MRSDRSAWSTTARLGHARDDALVGEVPQADPAEAELPVGRAGAAAAVAARCTRASCSAAACATSRSGALRAIYCVSPSSVSGRVNGIPSARRSASPCSSSVGGGGDRDVEAADRGDLVVVDLREDDLLADPEREVAATVDRARVEPAEVADARERDRDRAGRGTPTCGRRAASRAPTGMPSRTLKPAIDLRARRTCARWPAIVVSSSTALSSCLRVGLRLADAHVERDLLEARHLHRRAQAELVLQARADLLLVRAPSGAARSRSARVDLLSISWPQSARLQTRTCTSRALDFLWSSSRSASGGCRSGRRASRSRPARRRLLDHAAGRHLRAAHAVRVAHRPRLRVPLHDVQVLDDDPLLARARARSRGPACRGPCRRACGRVSPLRMRILCAIIRAPPGPGRRSS